MPALHENPAASNPAEQVPPPPKEWGSGMIDRSRLAALIGVRRTTIRDWANRGTAWHASVPPPPEATRIGHRARYAVADVWGWWWTHRNVKAPRTVGNGIRQPRRRTGYAITTDAERVRRAAQAGFKWTVGAIERPDGTREMVWLIEDDTIMPPAAPPMAGEPVARRVRPRLPSERGPQLVDHQMVKTRQSA